MLNEQKTSKKRQIAYKVRIKDISEGQYVRVDGWEPNYVVVRDDQKVSRINLIGTVVAKEDANNYQSFLIDDGSGRMSVRSFQDSNISNKTEIGDIILLIGRIREYGNDRYIVPEIVKKIENKAWIKVRMLELKKQEYSNSNIKKEPEIKKESGVSKSLVSANKEKDIHIKEKDPADKIYDLIKELDKGSGADVQEVVERANSKDFDKIINNLLERGDVFEIRRGRLKVLE